MEKDKEKEKKCSDDQIQNRFKEKLSVEMTYHVCGFLVRSIVPETKTILIMHYSTQLQQYNLWTRQLSIPVVMPIAAGKRLETF